MPPPATPKRTAQQIRQELKSGGSSQRAAGVQWFFKEEIQSHGWRTAPLRKAAGLTRRKILRDHSLDFLMKVADDLFHGSILEEKIFAVFLLENITDKLGPKEFRIFEAWLARVSSWADHDGLVSYLLGPMMVAEPKHAARVFVWAKQKNRWHRRAAAVALIRGARVGLFESEIIRISNLLLYDEDDMVQKGLGWLLREWTRDYPDRALPFLMKIRTSAPRLVLRTACEKLAAAEKKNVLGGTTRNRAVRRNPVPSL
jgi:3-methyladenine DNA glycosylase AlkD